MTAKTLDTIIRFNDVLVKRSDNVPLFFSKIKLSEYKKPANNGNNIVIRLRK